MDQLTAILIFVSSSTLPQDKYLAFFLVITKRGQVAKRQPAVATIAISQTWQTSEIKYWFSLLIHQWLRI